MRRSSRESAALSRRHFVGGFALGAAALVASPLLSRDRPRGDRDQAAVGPAHGEIPLERDWLFGGRLDPEALTPRFDDAAFSRVTVPHSVARLGWRNWHPAAWQDVWVYRRHFRLPEGFRGRRVFLHFEGVMVGAAPTINGHALPPHLGGYLPFRYEIGEWLVEGDNVLAVAVDARWSQVPPEGSPNGSAAVDFLEPGGILRPVRLEAVPAVYVADVFAKPVRVLEADHRVDVVCAIDAAAVPRGPIALELELRDGERILDSERRTLRLEAAGRTDITLTLSRLGRIELWDLDSPRLYRVVATLMVEGRPLHDHAVRIGFREARFTRDGFFLNGRRLQLFGLNRHELFPYVGYAMPRRVMRRDAEILRREFNCNIVRCSHYPQSPEFLDACDELGLMVWEEMPGWHFIGDQAWQDLALRDVQDMVRRDRNRPSVVIWGARVNESANLPPFHDRLREACHALDDSRPTSGAMSSYSTENWAEDVYAKNDYRAPVGPLEPLPGWPYLITESVGQFNYDALKGFDFKYRRAGDVALQRRQALLHASAHDKAAADPRICGVIAWCAFDYGSQRNSHDVVKCPGVADVFRIPKLGASFYLAQGDPHVRPVIAPDFYWDFGPQTPRGPGKEAAIFSNCERLELFVGGRRHASVLPDRVAFPRLAHPPFFVDLDVDGAHRPELRIDGYVGGRRVVSLSFSSDPARDRLALQPDDLELDGDGSDATRVIFKVVDAFGAERAFASGHVGLEVVGPGVIVGDNPFSLAESGGVGAVWVKAVAGGRGRITVTARHPALRPAAVAITVRPGPPEPA